MVTRVPLPMLKTPCTPSLGAGRGHVGGGDVADVDEVARLLAVAEDRHGHAAQDAVGEDRDDVAVGVVALVDAVDVEVAQADVAHAVELVVDEAHLLGGQLAGAVGRVGVLGMVLGDGQRLQLAEDAGRRREHDAAQTVPARGLEHVERADDVDLRVLDRIVDRTRVADAGGQVEDHVAALHGGRARPRRRARRPRWKGTPGTRFSAKPLDRSSSTTASCPWSSSRRTMLEPMKPAPPVTATFKTPPFSQCLQADPQSSPARPPCRVARSPGRPCAAHARRVRSAA